MFSFRRFLWAIVPIFLIFSTGNGHAQKATQAITAAQAHGQLLLVLPFDNRTGNPNMDWIGTGAADILNRRLAAAGFLAVSHDDRLYALDRMGLPPNFRPSRATTIRIAQLLDADVVIIGSYTLTGTQLTASAQLLNMHKLTLSKAIPQSGDLKDILDTLNGLAWNIAKTLDPTYPVAEQTFLAADAPLRPDAFESYIRGITAESPSARITHLREAVRLSPQFTPAIMELGKAYFSNQDYDLAASTFGELPRDDPNALEADFDRGLALLYTAHYLQAQDAFAFVAAQLPLPEVVNNEGVAASRRGRDGAALFQQAVSSDPRDADYHFNLAIALRKKNDLVGARREIEAVLKLQPQDSEARAFAVSLKNSTPLPATTSASTTAAPNEGLPLERIKRNYNETEFRQAAFEIEQMQEARLAMLPAAERAQKLVANGDQYIHRGLILEAEREYQAALAADASSAAAHAGLAEVRERSLDVKAARTEAQESLHIAPNVPAYLVLARLDLATNELPAAASEVSDALRIAPGNATALSMKQVLQSKGQQIP